MSLAVAGPAPLEALVAALGTIELAASPSIELSSLGVFVSAAPVVFLGVTPAARLLERNEDVHRRLDAASIRVRDLYRPGRWVPHCTLAMHVVDVAGALRALSGASLPIAGRASGVHLVEVPTGKVRASLT